ncbi:hypothetical protein N431DRAFT_433822 [Stipitochalara longipes BDJ]|nr:hypothetical protein N431DRAFT_433822 [Stipitochalara longipes BDJ]
MTDDETKSDWRKEKAGDGTAGDGRAKIKKGKTSKYKKGHKVFYNPGGNSPLEGPYLISEVLSPQRYVLCHETDYTPIKNGEEVDESRLTTAP